MEFATSCFHGWRRRVLFAAVALLPATMLSAQTTVVLDGHSKGRIFEGIGAVSAGASSRLLVDYPEPYRSQILDYLFKPDYGASLQHLKVEIGADVNSTDGSEPSSMRTRDDQNYTRGYEWWLMREAKRRNPDIVLDSLAWGASGWVGNGTLYTKDMTGYVANFLLGAKKVQGLDIPLTGVWNERKYNADYVELLHQVLAKQVPGTKLVCCDQYGGSQWGIVTAMEQSPELKGSVDIVSVHYPRKDGKVTTPEAARTIGRPLWSSEDQPDSSAEKILSRDWAIGGRSLAKLYNRNYLEGSFTATEIWSPVTSYYDILAAPNSGLMYANTPWSGHYEVQGAIWATAHTTQFAKPGWQYMDSSCGYMPEKGSYVSLKSPNGRDWSAIVETIDAKKPQRVEFQVRGGLAATTVHVWETNSTKTFEHIRDVSVEDGSFEYTFDPDSLYSLTTTTGQHKGTAVPPPSSEFPFPYRENFETTAIARAPKYLADQDGAFEVHPCAGRQGKCLEQMITTKPIPWSRLPNPWTLAGDEAWRDYDLAVDVYLPAAGQASAGQAALIGRIDSADVFTDDKAVWPSGYVLTFDADGKWNMASYAYNKPAVALGSGVSGVRSGSWHRVVLGFRGDLISATVDGRPLISVHDASHKQGMVGIGGGWNRVQFDDLAVSAPER
jgi:hypothetical protein